MGTVRKHALLCKVLLTNAKYICDARTAITLTFVVCPINGDIQVCCCFFKMAGVHKEPEYLSSQKFFQIKIGFVKVFC